MWLFRLPGVYRPQGDTWLLARALRSAGVAAGGAVLDVGCGAGALSVLAAASLAPRSVTAVDVSRRAVGVTRLNAAVRGLDVRGVRSDAVEYATGRVFDLILANPPYVPGADVVPERGARRAWDAGRDGRGVLDRLCAVAPLALAPGGVLLLVHSALCDVDKTLRQLRGGGLKASVVTRAVEPFGPVMRARVARLRELGLVEPDQRTEELVVIRGDRPAT